MKQGGIVLIADTEVLFAFQSEDPHYEDLKKILERKGSEILIPQVACFEMLNILNSQNLLISDIREIFELIEEIMNLYNIHYVPFDLKNLVKGMEIYKEIFKSNKGTFFDSLMMGIATEMKKPLLGNDRKFHDPKITRKIKGFTAVTFKEAIID